MPDKIQIQDVLDQGRRQRIFRARHKLQQPGLVSHITQRAAGREPLFVQEQDYLVMLGLFKESTEKFGLKYHSFCLMPNHVHILVRPQEKNLARAMGSMFSRYAARFNHRYQRRGHLFGGPYRQSVCLDDSYLLAASIYIHLNPVRAGICDSARDYKWSSLSLFCRGGPVQSFVDPGPVLNLLHEDEHESRKEYERMISYAQGEGAGNALEEKGAVEKFCIFLAGKFPRIFKRLGFHGKEGKSHENIPEILELTELDRLAREFDSRPLRNSGSRKAKKYVVQQLLARGYKKTEIAERLNISRATVHNLLKA